MSFGILLELNATSMYVGHYLLNLPLECPVNFVKIVCVNECKIVHMDICPVKFSDYGTKIISHAKKFWNEKINS